MVATKPATRSLAQLEKVIAEGVVTFMAVGLAILEIRETKAYTEKGYDDLKSYLVSEWPELSERDAYRYLGAAEVKNEIEGVVQPQILQSVKSVNQFTELARLPKEKIVETLERSHAKAEESGTKLTAKLIRETAEELTTPKPTFQNILPPDPDPPRDTPFFKCPVCSGTGKVKARPICQKCSADKGEAVRMVSGSSPAALSYYYCPTPGCKESVKVPRPEQAIRTQPPTMERR